MFDRRVGVAAALSDRSDSEWFLRWGWLVGADQKWKPNRLQFLWGGHLAGPVNRANDRTGYLIQSPKVGRSLM